jgi:hypothetical protein
MLSRRNELALQLQCLQAPALQDDQSMEQEVSVRDVSVCPALPASLLGQNSLAGQVCVVQLLRALGNGHALLAQYKSREAIAAFAALPCQHYQTSWVLSHVGRAYFEMVDYAKACQFFVWSRNHDPYRLVWNGTRLSCGT